MKDSTKLKEYSPTQHEISQRRKNRWRKQSSLNIYRLLSLVFIRFVRFLDSIIHDNTIYFHFKRQFDKKKTKTVFKKTVIPFLILSWQSAKKKLRAKNVIRTFVYPPGESRALLVAPQFSDFAVNLCYSLFGECTTLLSIYPVNSQKLDKLYPHSLLNSIRRVIKQRNENWQIIIF